MKFILSFANDEETTVYAIGGGDLDAELHHYPTAWFDRFCQDLDEMMFYNYKTRSTFVNSATVAKYHLALKVLFKEEDRQGQTVYQRRIQEEDITDEHEQIILVHELLEPFHMPPEVLKEETYRVRRGEVSAFSDFYDVFISMQQRLDPKLVALKY